MKVKNNYLYDDNNERVDYIPTPNVSGNIIPKFVIIHYTANSSIESTINHFKNKSSNASSQIVIGKKGEIVQMAPLNKRAWHAGKSSWKGINGLNSHSIGIEVVNPGPLMKIGDNKYKTWYGEIIDGSNNNTNVIIDEKHRITKGQAYWLRMNNEQIESLTKVVKAIQDKYDIKEVLGHDDISPFRKIDPGPTLHREWFENINNRRDDIKEVYEVYGTNGEGLNVRHFPDMNSKTFSFGPLLDGTKVNLIEESGSWWKIETVKEKNIAWVHSSFLKLV